VTIFKRRFWLFFSILVATMIDKLTLRCEFKTLKDLGDFRFTNLTYPVFKLDTLGVPLEISLNKDGDIMNTRHPWESIPSSFEGMAFKVFDFRCTELDKFYIEIKASPAKLMLGHNLFGSSDFEECAIFMVNLLCATYPKLIEHLNMRTWFLANIDITFFSRADSNTEAMQFINALSNVSFGQTKSRTGYNGTAYFGQKNSRLKKIKVYAKHPETVEVLKKTPKTADIIDESLLSWSEATIRWEVTLTSRYLERLGVKCDFVNLFENNSLTKEKQIALWSNATEGLFKSLDGKEMKIMNDNEVKELLRAKFFKVGKTGKISYAAADSAFTTYRLLQIDGWEIVKLSLASKTFYRHVGMLTEAGLSRIHLQNLKGMEKSNVIPFIRFIGVDFGAQLPPGVTETDTGALLGSPSFLKSAVSF
jgi:II/X family phage/plasmid replication protein